MKKMLHLLPVTIFFLMFVGTVYGQQIKVTGRVSDATTGDPLPGVDILVKGTTNGTITGANGGYTINVSSSTDTLHFSYIGYIAQDIPVQGQSSINVALKPKVYSSGQLVVVGYGTQTRQDVTGSIGSVSSNQIQNETINTPDQALQGKIAGVQVHTNSHAPGGGISVKIRGTASLGASGSPLYVIDGMPISTSYRTGNGGISGNGAQPNPLNSIDPSDIASIQVLKGASAAAIYGSRGANGVVLISLKKGVAGHQNIDFESTVGMNEPAKKLSFMNAKQWANEVNQGASENGKPIVFTQQQISKLGAGTDWQNQIFRHGINEKYKLTFSGGTHSLRYFVSGDYNNTEGILRGSNLKRYSADANINANVNKKVTIGDNVMFTVTNDHSLRTSAKGYGTQPGVITALMEAPPTIPARDSNGQPVSMSSYTMGSGLENPVTMTDGYKQLGSTVRVISSGYVNYNILQGLNLKVRLGADIRDFRYNQYYPIGSEASGGANGRASIASDRSVNILDANTLSYQKSINTNNLIKVLAGFTYQQEKDNSLDGASFGFPSNYYLYNNLGLGSNPQSPGSGASRWRMLSYIGRVNYSYKDTYLLTASIRADGDSKFGANNKWGTFPSLAFGWRLGNTQFIKNLNTFSHLKLRLSWGKTGNEGIGTYRSESLIGTSFSTGNAYIYNGSMVPVAYPRNLANPNLSWEKTSEYDAGLDMGFFQDRLNISGDYYYKKTTALLLGVPIPDQAGFGSVLENIGSMKNQGVEVSVKSKNVTNHNFNWTTNFNIAANRNKVLSLGGAPYIYTGWMGGGNVSQNGRNCCKIQVGHPVGEFYGAIYQGIWKSQQQINQVGTMPSAKPGDMRFKDVNGDGVYNSSDDVFLGSGNPKFTFGLTNNISYKNWDLNVFVYGDYGNKVLDTPAQRYLWNGLGFSSKRVTQRWTPNNTNGIYPAASSGKLGIVSSNIVKDGSFLRVQNVTLSYNLPLDKWHFNGLRSAKIGVSADNLAIITKYPGYDPEVNSFGVENGVAGVDRYAYPSARTFRLDVKLGF